MGGPDSNGISRAPLYLGLGLQRDRVFVYAAFTLCGSLFQHDSTNSIFSHSAEAQQRFPDCPATPSAATAAALHCGGLGWPLFAHHYWGDLFDFFSSGYLDVSVHRVPLLYGVTGLHPWGCPIQISADQGLLAAPRGVSPLAASFVGCKCLGIRRMPFLP